MQTLFHRSFFDAGLSQRIISMYHHHNHLHIYHSRIRVGSCHHRFPSRGPMSMYIVNNVTRTPLSFVLFHVYGPTFFEMTIRNILRKNKTLLLTFLPPIVLLPLPLSGQSQESKCAYGLLLMAFYWTTETFPVAITATLPVILFPMMGISKVGDLASKYFHHITFVMIGGLAVAIAIEKWNVHTRIALRLLLTMGTTPKWLMLGFMLTTSFLSMWISNTATTSIMIPIAQAVLTQLMGMRVSRDQLKPDQDTRNDEKNIHTIQEMYVNGDTKVALDLPDVEPSESVGITIQQPDPDGKQKLTIQQAHQSVEQPEPVEGDKLIKVKMEEEGDFDFEALDPESKNLCKAMLLSICYAANCGGVATLTGTGANLVMKGQADLMSDGESGITFATWFVFAFPVAVINVLLAWLCLQVVYFGLRNLFKSGDKSEGEAVKKIIRSQYDSLGNMSFAEKAVMVHFAILVLCWFTLKPEFVPGWGSLFKHGYISDAVPAMIICCLLFVFPSSRNQNNANKSSATLLDWKTFNRKFPWGVALLLGGGFALAHACKESGLSLWLARMMAVMTGIPEWAMIAVICLVISLSTEVTTNTAVCTIFMPILADLAKGIHVHPIYIMLPAAISSSFAFMLPVATPPNTIAFTYGYLRIIDMVKVGWILNLLCVVIVTIAINTWGMAYFRLDVYPEWAVIQGQMSSSVSNSTFIHMINQTSIMTS
ncbi:solute carrier family 13 member 5-like isoform X3 [Mizuhopecten yessoensis]|uniref:solute carrier family 13 member 5-like isoform X3 n=1 Tax=Mizuhopecten yessoensis TaxID=6573 RepID=UPI000B45F8B6|nr:solute carrier family 13 member 5-like isoform X3 [Mizuhopecten yessoensis]